ncbi:sigma-70 family RNA polymerase sigma factor [Lentibacillus salinarum]|uniref:Sigma-70 family RNA polymerase sigma factor n=1 Tax=Lentibacillus salinarum TaxID=446820 RepID=A0ABW3ZVY5_9BACI
MEGKQKRFTFEEIFKQNELRIHYHIHRLNIRDPHHEYYQEGLVAMWNAYEKYEPDKGPLATYFNYTIRNRLIDLMRKQNREHEKDAIYLQEQSTRMKDGNYYRRHGTAYPVMQVADTPFPYEGIDSAALWKTIKDELTENQWKWVTYHVVEGLTITAIAEQEDTSREAVKSWGKGAKRKLRRITDEGM